MLCDLLALKSIQLNQLDSKHTQIYLIFFAPFLN